MKPRRLTGKRTLRNLPVGKMTAQQLYNLIRRATRDEDNARAVATNLYLQQQYQAMQATVVANVTGFPQAPEDDNGAPPTLQ